MVRGVGGSEISGGVSKISTEELERTGEWGDDG